MKSELPFVSIISLNWNNKIDILKLLSSIEKSDYTESKYEVIVVDNGSTDSSVSAISKKFPKTKIIELKKNYGVWARNLGFKRAKGEIIITADSDATIPKETIPKVVEKVQRDPKIGILGVKVLNKIKKIPEFSPMKLNFQTGTISMLDPEKETSKVTWVPFILSVIPAKTIKKVGYLDRRHFVYGEDVNFCLRVKKAGFNVVYWPGALTYHYQRKNRPDVDHSIKYHHYYKALFKNIYRFGNLFQKFSVTFFQLFLIPLVSLLKRKPLLLPARWWGFWWNLKNSTFETKLFLFSFVIGVVLRFFALSWHDFWFDEAFTYHLARLPIENLLRAVLSDNNPPLYYILIHFVLKFSQNEIVLRLPSLIANVAAIFIIYKFINKEFNEASPTLQSGYLLPSLRREQNPSEAKSSSLSSTGLRPRYFAKGDKKIAAISASLFAVSPLAIYIATETRLHSLAIFLGLLLTFSFFSLLKNTKFKNSFLFIIIGVLSLYTQYYLALLFLPFTIIIFRQQLKLSLKKWFLILVSVAAPVLPWFFLSLKTTHNGCSCPNSILSMPSSFVSPILGGIGEVTLRSFPSLPLYLMIFFVLISIFMLTLFVKGIKTTIASESKNLQRLHLFYLLPLSLLTLGGLFLPIFSPKAFAVFSPIFFVIVSVGINQFRSFEKKLLVMSVISLALTSIIQISNPFFAGQKLKPIYDIVKSDQTIPIAHTSVSTFYSLNFYSRGRQKNILVTQNPFSNETLSFIGGKKDEVKHDINSFWLVDSPKWIKKDEKERVVQSVYENFSVEEKYQIDNISVQYMTRK